MPKCRRSNCSEDLLLAASPESFRGQLIVAGAGGDEPISVAPVPLLFGMRSLAGTMTGSSIDAEDTLSFSSLQQIRPMIETAPLVFGDDSSIRLCRANSAPELKFDLDSVRP